MARFLHTRIRVSDLDRSIEWYCTHLGFEVQSRSDKSPAGNQIAHLELPGNEHTLRADLFRRLPTRRPRRSHAPRHMRFPI